MLKNSYVEYIIYELHKYDLTFADFVIIVGNYYPPMLLFQRAKLGFTILRKLLKAHMLFVQSMGPSDIVYKDYEETNSILQKAEMQVHRKYPADTSKFALDSIFEIPYLAVGNEEFTSVYERMLLTSDWKNGVYEDDTIGEAITFQQMMDYEHGKLDLYLGKTYLKRNK